MVSASLTTFTLQNLVALLHSYSFWYPYNIFYSFGRQYWVPLLSFLLKKNIYLFIWLCQVSVAAWGIQFPDQRLKPGPLHWEHWTTREVPSASSSLLWSWWLSNTWSVGPAALHITSFKMQVLAFESVLMKWMNLEPIIQSEINQKEKTKYPTLTHIYEI